jgi:hypothetical protein
METCDSNEEARTLEAATERPTARDERHSQGGAPDYPDPPERRDDDDDEEDEGGYPGINKPEMPATDRESIERPEKAPNPMDEPSQSAGPTDPQARFSAL